MKRCAASRRARPVERAITVVGSRSTCASRLEVVEERSDGHVRVCGTMRLARAHGAGSVSRFTERGWVPSAVLADSNIASKDAQSHPLPHADQRSLVTDRPSG